MRDSEVRVALVVRGVVEQALRDAGAAHLQLQSADAAQSRLITRWCELIFDHTGAALTAGVQTKTELLLGGPFENADLYPLGDLYASELAAFCPDCAVSQDVAELAARAGGLDELDAALRALLDERRAEATAFAAIPQLRDEIKSRLQQTRFRRARLGIVPKLGARTIGIDLFI
jgi:hypothetical protein